MQRAIAAAVVFFVLISHFAVVSAGDMNGVAGDSLPLGVIDPQLAAVGYSGREKLVYDVSWTGGIKIGELHLDVKKLPEIDDGYEIRAFVTTKNGAVDIFYPVEDLHVTRLKGPKKLPYHYEVWQKEGYKYRAHRVTEYDQINGYIRSMKNDKPAVEYKVDGETNNEFTAFFNSRLMGFDIGRLFMVPTFADKRRVEVAVRPVTRKILEQTIFGPVTTVEIMPVLTFKGLYDKQGDTVIWYTDDECRVPVQVNSKIIIGSLTAKLTTYDNPACRRYATAVVQRTP
jgi:hypothetical protein